MIPQFIKEKRPQIARLCRKYGVRKLWLIGSMARGDAKKRSDIDFLADFKPNLRREPFSIRPGRELKQELYKLFNRKVDVLSKSLLQPHWIDYVMNEAEIYYVATGQAATTKHSSRNEQNVSSARRGKTTTVSRKPRKTSRRASGTST